MIKTLKSVLGVAAALAVIAIGYPLVVNTTGEDRSGVVVSVHFKPPVRHVASQGVYVVAYLSSHPGTVISQTVVRTGVSWPVADAKKGSVLTVAASQTSGDMLNLIIRHNGDQVRFCPRTGPGAVKCEYVVVS